MTTIQISGSLFGSFNVFICDPNLFFYCIHSSFAFEKTLHSGNFVASDVGYRNWNLDSESSAATRKPEDTWVGEHQCSTTAKKHLLLQSSSFLTDSKRSPLCCPQTQRGRRKIESELFCSILLFRSAKKNHPVCHYDFFGLNTCWKCEIFSSWKITLKSS